MHIARLTEKGWQTEMFVDAPAKSDLKVTYGLGVPSLIPIVYAFDGDRSVSMLQWRIPATDLDLPWYRWSGSLPVPAREIWIRASTSYSVGGAIPAVCVALPSGDKPGIAAYTMAPISNHKLEIKGGTTWDSDFKTIVGWPTEDIFLATRRDDRLVQQSGASTNGRIATFPTLDTPWSHAIATYDANRLAHVYLLDDHQQLSVLHQTGWEMAEGTYGVASWTRAVDDKTGSSRIVALPIDGDVVRFYVDSHPDHVAILCFMSSGDLVLATQDPNTGSWARETVRVATSARTLLTTYRTQVTLVDEAGAPADGEILRLSAERPVELLVGDEWELVGPTSALQVTTDARGRVVFRSIATGLTAPAITITTPGAANGRVVRPDAPLHAYLAGKGGLPLRAPFSGQVLRDAKVKTGPLIDPKLWVGDVQPDAVVKRMAEVFGVPRGDAPPPDSHGFLLEHHDGERPSLRALSSPETLADELARLRARADYGGVVDNVADFFGDIWEGMKRTGLELKAVLVDIKDGAVKIFAKIKDAFYEFGNIVLRTLRAAAEVVSAMLTTLRAKIEHVIEWARALVNIDDAFKTAAALQDGLSRLEHSLREGLAMVTPDRLKTILAGDKPTTLGKLGDFLKRPDVANRSLQDMAVPPPVTQRAPTRADLDGVLGNWLYDQLMPMIGKLPALAANEALFAQWQKVSSQFSVFDHSLVKALGAALAELLRPDDPRAPNRLAFDKLADLVIQKIDAVFDLAANLIPTMYEAVQSALGSFDALLRAPIAFPPVVELMN